MVFSAERKYGLSTEALKENYRGKIEELGESRLDFCEYYELMQECVGKFRGLAHLALYSPAAYETRKLDFDASKQADLLDDLERWRVKLFNDPMIGKRYEYLAKRYGTKIRSQSEGSISNLTFKDINADTAYVKISSFRRRYMLDDQDTLSEWFAENADKKNIIIDITGNGGGSDFYWINLIVAPNIDQPLKYTSCYITPYGEETREQFALNGVGPEDLNPNLSDLLKLPRFDRESLSEVKYYKPTFLSVFPSDEKKTFNGRFFLLVDGKVYSAAEGFALFCKATGFATLVGENTKGDGGGGDVFDIKLPKSSLLLRFRAMDYLNPDGSSNVEFGTTPDVAYHGAGNAKNVSFLGVCLDYIKSLDQ